MLPTRLKNLGYPPETSEWPPPDELRSDTFKVIAGCPGISRREWAEVVWTRDDWYWKGSPMKVESAILWCAKLAEPSPAEPLDKPVKKAKGS